MLQLADWLREWAADKVASDGRFKHCSFIISDAFEPGEGEHKVCVCVQWVSQATFWGVGCLLGLCLTLGICLVLFFWAAATTVTLCIRAEPVL